MIIRLTMQIIADIPDEKYGYLDPFTLTVNKVQELIKSGKVRKIDRSSVEKNVNIHAEITGELLKNVSAKWATTK